MLKVTHTLSCLHIHAVVDRRFLEEACFASRLSSPFCCIRLVHSMGDEIGVIVTLGSLLLALEKPGEMCWCGFSYLRTTPALPKGARASELLLPPLFLAKSN